MGKEDANKRIFQVHKTTVSGSRSPQRADEGLIQTLSPVPSPESTCPVPKRVGSGRSHSGDRTICEEPCPWLTPSSPPEPTNVRAQRAAHRDLFALTQEAPRTPGLRGRTERDARAGQRGPARPRCSHPRGYGRAWVKCTFPMNFSDCRR